MTPSDALRILLLTLGAAVCLVIALILRRERHLWPFVAEHLALAAAMILAIGARFFAPEAAWPAFIVPALAVAGIALLLGWLLWNSHANHS
jgi:hypothetical protein